MSIRTVSIQELSTDPHPLLHGLREQTPVAWVPALDAWLVTSHDLCKQVMLDADTFTVDDPRFSTQQVIGPSMLSLDGLEHRRHRDPFAPAFRAARIRALEESVAVRAASLVQGLQPETIFDLRSSVAAPLAVGVMAEILDLGDVDTEDLLRWYEEIVDAVHVVTAGGEVPASGHAAFEELGGAVIAGSGRSALLSPIAEDAPCTVDEIVSNVAVLLFGGIVTAESSMAIAFRYLLDVPGLMTVLQADRSLVEAFVEETLRLEPSAAAVDRYTTRQIEIGGVTVARGDLVRVSLSAANRDPEVFPRPDELDITRANPGQNLTFARGPHACLGVHLARLEVRAAVGALLDWLPGLRPAGLDPIEGLVFRAPATVRAVWPGNERSGK